MTTFDFDRLPAATHMGTLELGVTDMSTELDFYTRGVGLAALQDSGGRISLGFDDHGRQREILTLTHKPGLRRPAASAAGLYHTAIVFESSEALASSVRSMFRHFPHTYIGAADHLVSEAFYFTDPEGNGLELYVDRPRDQWSWQDGRVSMSTLWLDPAQFVQQHLNLEAATPGAGSLGHVHLQVGDVPTAHAFYVDALGFDETARLGSQALFVSAGGYHHHMAMNTWQSRGAGPRTSTLGLGVVDITVPDIAEVNRTHDRLCLRGIAGTSDGRTLTVRDPWNNELRISPAA